MSTSGSERLAWLAELHRVMDLSLWAFLRGVTDHELDWRIHEEANTIRWILGHLLYIETWTADAIDGDGLYLQERRTTFDAVPLETLAAQFRAAGLRTREKMQSLAQEDLARKIDMLGVMTASLGGVLSNHVTHLSGHVYQVRFIRGTYSRVHGTRKADFDPW
jgi:hypothetical protein